MLNPSLSNQEIARKVRSIVKNHTLLNGMSTEELEQIVSYSVIKDDYRVLDIISHYHTGIYGYDEQNPDWLKSDFKSDRWVLMFDKHEREINWGNIYLNDGSSLTDVRHKKLLNSFKFWITASDNPLENGGKILSRITVYQKVNRIITLINAILLHATELSLAEHHLLHVNDDFWLSILVNCAENGIRSGIYESEKRIASLLNNIPTHYTEYEVSEFVKLYPYIKRNISEDERIIKLTKVAESCLWLFEKGFYKKTGATHYEGNSSVMNRLLFDKKIIFQSIKLPSYPELHLKEPRRISEYPAVDNRDNSVGATQHTISVYIDSIRLLNTNLGRAESADHTAISEVLTATKVNTMTNLKSLGRTRTQSPAFVFCLIRQCYEFAKEHLSNGRYETSLLIEIVKILSIAKDKSCARYSNKKRPSHTSAEWDPERHKGMADTARGEWLRTEAIEILSNKYKSIGIEKVENFSVSTPDRHDRIRNNESLFELFSVFQGAIQILVGAIMARRQDELIQLNAEGNLSPNIDPYTVDVDTEYSLVFKAKKTGVSGVNETIERPIPLSIAKFVWEIEQFNRQVRVLKLNKGKLLLFNQLDSTFYKFTGSNSKSYNLHLDAACDYFQTNLVKYENGEYKRNYVRQHQLRRFFAMAFFWSKGFDGMDALRWMLGHSDLEHLYHYITESETGAVLNGAKASVIVRGCIDKQSDVAKLDGIEKVREIISKRITGSATTPITVEPLSDAVEEYKEDLYSTAPPIDQIRTEQEIEATVIELLEQDKIRLEPHFFTVTDAEGNNIKSFNLVLQIRDIE